MAVRHLIRPGLAQAVALVALLVSVILPTSANSPVMTLPGVDSFGAVHIPVYGLALDLDTRPDIDGLQSSMTAVKDFPTGIRTLVGQPGLTLQPRLPPGAVVKAELSGPAYGDEFLTIEGPPNGLMELPNIQVDGDYSLRNVRLEDGRGRVMLRRHPGKQRVRIKVIKKLLVTQVTSRALTLDEIKQKGIVIDEKNFTAVNFTVGLTLGSEKVEIDMPIAIPTAQAELTDLRPPDLTRLPSVQSAFDRINIPNFSLSGFRLNAPPELKEAKGIELPPINGVIVIPGNIGFLNQFFSVILQATNVAPDGSQLILQEAKATIALPAGKDGIKASGDDPLRVAETRDHGVQEVLPLLDAEGSANIAPQATNQAEFLVEGLSEGTHRVDFDIRGDLFIPQLGKTVPMTGSAGGVVQVRNPTFNITLAHPDVVREGEAYSIFATVTNTSSTPANLFQLGLNTRSMSGARVEEGEDELKNLESLGPGQAESFEFKLVAMTTGEVTGTVFLADEGINGSFILTAGVGDTGIPLSPDTLVLPKEARYLPKEPDLLFQAVRLLGQAYSVATAPAGTLPPAIPRMRKGFVFDQAVALAQAGLRTRFGQTALSAARDIAMDYLGADVPRLEQLYPNDEQAREQRRGDLVAFDVLRRLADAGHDFSDVLGEMLAAQMTDPAEVARLQADWAEVYASRSAHLSFGVSSRGPPVALRITDVDGKALGQRGIDEPVSRELPFAARLPLFNDDKQSATLLLLTSPTSDRYELEFDSPPSAGLRVSLIVPASEGMQQLVFPELVLDKPAHGVVRWQRRDQAETAPSLLLELDSDGDGTADQTLEPEIQVAIVDRGPRLLGVRQWAKGAQPHVQPSFERGDPLGRMIGVLYDEPVDRATATDPANYQVADNDVLQVAIQPDRQLLFMVLERPVGPFVERELQVNGVTDLAGHALDEGVRLIAPDSDRGIGGRFRGQVVLADGKPVPFATVKYIQPLEKQAMPGTGCLDEAEVRDAVITTYEADREGRFSIDYVLQADFPQACPDNVDVWLNEHSPPGTQNFKLEATDPETGEIGKVSTRIHFDGQSMGLKVVIRGYGTIKGKAVTEDGLPIVGGDPGSRDVLWVRARNISTGEWFSSWVDADGNYAFPRDFTAENGKRTEVPRMPTGNVILQLVRPSDGYTAVTTVNLSGGGATVTQDLTMIPPNRYSRVTGRVLEADGVTGAANIKVQIAGEVLSSIDLYSRQYEQSVVGSVLTDQDGHFVFEQVPTGPIDVRAFRQATYEQARVESQLDEGKEQSLVLVFPGTGGTVRGLVRDAFGNPVAGATVAGGPTLTEADAGGFFEIKGMPLGEYTIYAQGKDSPALGKVQVRTLGPKDVQQVVITLQPLGSVAGTVYQADGETPIRAQRVQLWAEPDKGVLAEVLSDEQGMFRFDNYPLGKYSVRAVQKDHGDGGMTYTSLRYAGDVRDADIRFRGMGEIKGRVVQSNGTPVMSDVIVTGKVWRVISSREGEQGDVFMEFIRAVQSQVDEATAKQIEDALQAAGLSAPPTDFFMMTDESRLIASDVKGPNGEVTGRFRFSNALAGSYRVAAFGPFLAPAEQTLEIPRTRGPDQRRIDMGDVVLEPATGKVAGTVYMPDGKTPVGSGVTVKIRSLDSSGSVMTATGGVSQPVLPEYSVTTDGNGRYHFPLVLRGRFTLVADTGAPPRGQAAKMAAEIRTDRFNDEAGDRLLNVRLYGGSNGVVPAGETLQADIRLLDAAAVRLRVVESDGKTPVSFAQISVRTESALDVDEEASMAKVFANKAGEIELFPIIEGRFSVQAKQPLSPARGRSEGVITAAMPAAEPLATTVTLGAVTTAAGNVVKAKVFGSVTGKVLKADGSAQTNPVQVTVKVAGASLLATSDDQGHFDVTDVPGGALQIEAFEPFTARRAVAKGQLREQNEAVAITLKLIGLGTVSGSVLSSDGTQRMPGLDVLLYPSGRFSDRLISRSDSQGLYELPGVPMGHYRIEVKDYENGLTGQAQGDIVADDERRTTDVLLEPSGAIIGTVYGPGVRLDADGKPLTADALRAARATVQLQGAKSQQTLQTDDEGRFASNRFLPLGHYRITVRPQDEDDGVIAEADLTFNGERKALALALAGYGSVRGVVLDSAGQQPVKAARVSIRSHSPFSAGVLTRFTEEDGSFVIDQLPVGEFEIAVKTTIAETELGASLRDRIDSHGQRIVFAGDGGGGDRDRMLPAIALQPSGGVRGRVLGDDGLTPVAAAVIELVGKTFTLGRETDANGWFQFDALPLGDYRIGVVDPASNGLAARRLRLERNGQVQIYAAIALDSQAPEVVTTLPKPNTLGVDGSSPIQVTFSEPMDPESINPRTFQVLVDGAPVRGSLSVSSDGLSVTFTPARPMPDLKQVQVLANGDTIGFEGQVLARGIRDESGVGLRDDLRLSFTTRDATPPRIVTYSPAPDAKGVDLDQVVRLEFSEPMDEVALQGFRLVQDGKPVDGRLDMPRRQQGRLLVFTPRRRLSPNASFAVQLPGPAVDLTGNALVDGPVDYRFDTLDTKPPRIRSLALAAEQEAIEGKRVMVTAELDDTDDVAMVEFFINRQLVGSASAPPWDTSIYLDPALGREPIIEALARDTSGNSGPRSALPLQVASNTPPTVRIVSPGNSQVSAGQIIGLQIVASDDVGLEQIAFTANQGSLAGQREDWNRSAAAQASFDFKIPADYPIGADIELMALATDTQGLIAASTPVRLSVLGKLPPEVFIDSPSDGTAVDPGAEIQVTLHADDPTGIIELGLNGSGLINFSQVYALDPPTAHAAKTFTVRIPGTAAATETLTLAARALDSRRNAGNRSIQLRINDRIAPAAKLTKNWGNAERVEPGLKASLRVDASDEIGIESYAIVLGDRVLYEKAMNATKKLVEGFDVVMPQDLTLGSEVALVARVRDTSGNVGESEPLQQIAADMTPPTVTVESSLAKDTKIHIGEKLSYVLKAEDAYGLAKVVYSVDGLYKDSKETPLDDAGVSLEQQVEFTVPEEAKVGGDIRMTLNAWDMAGNHRSTTHYAKVHDQVRPALQEVDPLDGEQNAIPDARMRFQFSEYLDRRSVNAETLPITGPDGPVAGRYSFGYYRPDIVYFQPEPPLKHGVDYQVRFTEGITDPTGNKLIEERQIRFVTDNTNPMLVEQYPTDKAEGVPTKPVIRLHFDERLKRSTITEASIRLMDDVGEMVPTEMRIKEQEQLIELVLKETLKLDSTYQIALSGSMTDLAGNPIVAGERKTFDTRMTSFTTGALLFVSPKPDIPLAEDRAFSIQVSGEGMDIADVVYEVNGRRLPPVGGPDFRVRYRAPLFDQSDALEIVALARDKDQKTIARRQFVVPVEPKLRREPAVLGVAAGGKAILRLHLPKAQTKPVNVTLTVADVDVANVAQTQVSIPAGKQVYAVVVEGKAIGNTRLHAQSALGEVYAAISVSERVAGRMVAVSSPVAALTISPPVDQRAQAGVVHTGVGVARLAYDLLPDVVLAHLGQYELNLPVHADPLKTQAFRLVSGEAEIVSVADSVQLAAGDALLPVKLQALAAGVSWIDMISDTAHYRVPVQVQTEAAMPANGKVSNAVGISISPTGFDTRIHLAQLGKRILSIPVLGEPTPIDLPVRVTSGDSGVVTVPPTASVRAGTREVMLDVEALAAGSSRVSLWVGGHLIRLSLTVVERGDDYLGVADHTSSGVTVAEAGSLGTLHQVAGQRQSWTVRLPHDLDSSVRTATLKSRNPQQVSVEADVLAIAANRDELRFSLLTKPGADTQTVLDVQLGNRAETIQVITLGQDKTQPSVPVLMAPAPGIERK